VDSLIHDKEALAFTANLLGHKRICMGSDYPFPLGEVSLTCDAVRIL
jgi:aminocarboxymuconate-semialdehyde decarboxylase